MYQTVQGPVDTIIVKIKWKSQNLMNDIDSYVNMETQYRNHQAAWW